MQKQKHPTKYTVHEENGPNEPSNLFFLFRLLKFNKA